MLKNETINSDYENLYCQVPRSYLPDEATLTAAATKLHCESKDNLFNEHVDLIVRAAVAGQDFVASNEFHRVLGSSASDKSKLTAIYQVLAAVSLTNSCFKIEPEVRPFSQFKQINFDDHEQVIAFLQYLNNFLLEIVGMRSAREHTAEYFAFIQKCTQAEDSKTQLFGWRACLSFCRALTSMQIQPELLDFLKDQIAKVSAVQKECMNVYNLACGCCGRIAVTLLDEAPQRGNEFRIALRKCGLKYESDRAPCVMDLKKFLQPRDVQNNDDDDDMY